MPHTNQWMPCALGILLAACSAVAVSAERPDRVLDAPPEDMMLRYYRALAEQAAASHPMPPARESWERRRLELRDRLWQSLGDFPLEDRPPLNARVTGTLDHGDHRVEKVVYESLPGLFVTALVYVPNDVSGRIPAVACVNGHWPEAKSTDHIQQRCMGLARMGVVAFCQDVIGTGERRAPPGSPHVVYHGTYRGAAPWITDRSLLGYVMYECLRAVDYLETRPEVDPQRIVATGASGGGNQSMFFAALDDRLAGAVPVCSVSSYENHMGATACVCEMVPGVLRYTNQWELLGLHAPRPLLCMAATHDTPVFLPRGMFETLEKTAAVYRLYDAEPLVRGVEFDAPHSYNKEMRELFYRHVARHLQGLESPRIVEPEDLPVEPATALECGLPAESETLQSLTFRRARELAEAVTLPESPEQWRAQRRAMVARLEADVLGGADEGPGGGPAGSPLAAPDRSGARSTKVREFDWEGHRIEHWTLETEPGVLVPAVLCLPRSAAGAPQPAVLVVDELGKAQAFERGLVSKLSASGRAVLAVDVRGTGETAGTVPEYNYEVSTPDYNLSNYSILLGRPLAGMRVFDLRCALDFLIDRPEVDPSRVALLGRGRGAFAALLTAAFDERVGAVACEELLDTWVTPDEFRDVGLSYLVPRILSVGDMAHLAAGVAPRPLLLVNPVDGQRRPLDPERTAGAFAFTRLVYGIAGRESAMSCRRAPQEDVCETLVEWIEGVGTAGR